ncbi:hypothetical protein FVE85_1819 [Porphyridium purpureum]|uniref:Phytanoyl-CoA dioxygenase family protein n=1 Tax=Porphyridium purpureum TaxID=35688 RepID=A0A5J4YY79_PORPP|nr:hypothetical protein FVE85_1819 [Porphyridium purpureum]|eukprot:POR6523..scf209_3
MAFALHGGNAGLRGDRVQGRCSSGRVVLPARADRAPQRVVRAADGVRERKRSAARSDRRRDAKDGPGAAANPRRRVHVQRGKHDRDGHAREVGGIGTAAELNEPVHVAPQDQLSFERRGHLCLRNLLSRQLVLEWLAPAVRRELAAREYEVLLQKVEVMYEDDAAVMASLTSMTEANVQVLRNLLAALDGELPFLQLFRLWERNGEINKIARSTRFKSAATALLGTKQVVLYQDSCFLKRMGDKATRWHSDLNMCPLDTSSAVTFWIPMHDIPAPEHGGTGLVYADASHRDFSLPFWYGRGTAVDGRYPISHHNALAAGDVSVHAGWTLHAAPGCIEPEGRLAYTCTYVAADALVMAKGVRERVHREDHRSWAAWIDRAQPGKSLLDRANRHLTRADGPLPLL